MKEHEGLPVVKFMMLLSSLAPLFILIGIRGMDELICYKYLWVVISIFLIVPFLILLLRLNQTKKK